MSRYTPKIFGVAIPPPLVPGGVAPKFGSEKVSRYTGVSQLQLRVSRYHRAIRRGCSVGPNILGYSFVSLGCDTRLYRNHLC